MSESGAVPGRYDHWFSTAKVLISIAVIAWGTYAILEHFAPG